MIGTYQEHDLPLEVTRLLSSSLVEADHQGKMLPNLVKGWETNNDATSFKFKLRDDLVWADNSKILSFDLSFNVPDTEISFPESNTLQFKLKETYSPFPSLLTKPVFKKGTLLGTGPYRAVKIEKSKIFITKITLEPVRLAGGPNSKDLPKIFIRFYPNETVAQVGFSIGEVQALLGLTNLNFAGSSGAKLMQKTDYRKIVTVLYSTKDKLLSNRSIRQALSFQAPEIEGFEVANNPFPKNSWAFDEGAKKYLNNETGAKEALGRAKPALDEQKLNKEVTLTATSNLEEVAKKIAEEWKQLEIDVKIRVESGIPQNFQALLITQSVPYDPDQYFLWHSTQQNSNLSKYSSARVDKDLEDGRKTSDQEERKEKYFDFQRTLLEDAPATFLYFPKYNIVYLKKVESSLNQLLPIIFPNSQ